MCRKCQLRIVRVLEGVTAELRMRADLLDENDPHNASFDPKMDRLEEEFDAANREFKAITVLNAAHLDSCNCR